MRPDCAAAERGFTLLEVLVALLIAAIGLGALFQGSLGGLRAADLAGRTEEAVSRARSRLAVLGQGAPLAAEDRGGDDGGGYRWRVRVAPLATRPGGAGEPSQVLYDVAVTIAWGSGGTAREVTLQTRRLGAAPPPPP
ncbi:MAG: prepilin-type N-terminal cleavage/methylation domain-containing protein [Acetobacteraceae bacterium]|nr:MAG: prepilin-type N-terminal cleavage/methylation domain-containing protein [Acetobacteraceae bacterium]